MWWKTANLTLVGALQPNLDAIMPVGVHNHTVKLFAAGLQA